MSQRVLAKPSSNGRNLDGTSMNVNNRLGERPSIRLFPNLAAGGPVHSALAADDAPPVDPAATEEALARFRERQRKLREAQRATGEACVQQEQEQQQQPPQQPHQEPAPQDDKTRAALERFRERRKMLRDATDASLAKFAL
jgi:predicted secreted protein